MKRRRRRDKASGRVEENGRQTGEAWEEKRLERKERKQTWKEEQERKNCRGGGEGMDGECN